MEENSIEMELNDEYEENIQQDLLAIKNSILSNR